MPARTSALASSVVMAFAVAAACLAGCSAAGSPAAGSTAVREDEAPPGMTVIVDGLDHPTQFVDGPDGTLVVAQLAGGESDQAGEVIVVDVAAGTRRTLLSGLDKPTGVLWHDGVLWVMIRRGLLRADWPDAASDVGPTTVVLRDLPFNGRSQGTLTLLADGQFLYETTGNIIAGEVEPGSGTLWAFDPTTNTSSVVATGLKNAYGHALLPDGRIVTTEIGDNIANPPLEEIDVIPSGPGPSDLGWPQCPGDTDCDGVVRPLALFATESTPTSVAVVGDDVYVSLFVTGQLMHVSLSGWQPGDAPRDPVEIASDLAGPHTILPQPDGTLWISEHFTGRIVSITP